MHEDDKAGEAKKDGAQASGNSLIEPEDVLKSMLTRDLNETFGRRMAVKSKGRYMTFDPETGELTMTPNRPDSVLEHIVHLNGHTASMETIMLQRIIYLTLLNALDDAMERLSAIIKTDEMP